MQNSITLMQENIEMKYFPTTVEVVPISYYDDVHISPNYIEFKDAREGLTCSQKIVIKNVGTKPAFIRIRKPSSLVDKNRL